VVRNRDKIEKGSSDFHPKQTRSYFSYTVQYFIEIKQKLWSQEWPQTDASWFHNLSHAMLQQWPMAYKSSECIRVI